MVKRLFALLIPTYSVDNLDIVDMVPKFAALEGIGLRTA
jgi:hypothetical protein